MLKRLFRRLTGRAAPSYEAARAVLEREDVAARRGLAGAEGVEPEILYYLATDADPETRRRIAGNASTPAKADRLLADDGDEDVRAALAAKIGRLLPELARDERPRMSEMVLETLEKLASDQLPRVRAIVAEQIKRCETAPRDLVLKLARDAEMQVAAPILEYSPLLSDADLHELIALTRVSEALSAIARRRDLSPAICDAVIATLDIAATAALIANADAHISGQAFERLLDRAADVKEWHAPLVGRPNLSTRLIRRVAGFVSSNLIERLAARAGLDPETEETLRRAARDSIARGGIEHGEARAVAEANVAEALAAGALDDRFVATAAEAGDREALALALAALTGAPEASVRRVLESRSARAVTALIWRARLSMRVSVAVQKYLLRLPAGEMLPARDGVHFPMTSQDMATALELFGIAPDEA